MSRKNDLSNLLSKKTDHIRKRHNNRPYFNNQTTNTEASTSANNNAEQNNETGNSTNPVQNKLAEAGLRSVGVPKGVAKGIASSDVAHELAEKGTFTLKMPLPIKIAMTALTFGIPLVGLMLFVVLFSSEASAASYGSFAYGQTCTTVTVTNTGCNSNGGNCTNKYDGNVALEDYIAGVVAAEVGIANNLEYYKVAAIAARTYFLKHVGSSCTVKGNATFQAYMDVEDSSNAELIKQAVEETKGLVLVKDDDLADTYYASACVVNADEDYYYVRYGTISLGKANFQKIPKEWDKESAFGGYLAGWYSEVDKSNTDYENKSCPNNHDYGMSQIGALYLITGENYDYEDVIEYYYGNDVEIMNNVMQLSGVNGFINPTTSIHCSSPYGPRTHPVTGEVNSFHGGLDIGVYSPIYATKSGTVSYVLKNITLINATESNAASGYGAGNYIIIDHGDGVSTVYMHIKYGTIPDSIYIGAPVEQGQEIGYTGSTGRSTGVHLHYEVRINGEKVEPADYLDLSEATGTCRR